MNRRGLGADINWPMRACIFSVLRSALQSRCIAAVPRREFITSISSVYITRSISIDSLSEKEDRRVGGVAGRRGRKKNEGIYSRGTFDKNNNFAMATAIFRRNNNARQYRALTAGPAKTLFHLSRLIPTVTTDRSINTRPHYQKMKMAVARSMRDQYLCGTNAAPR